MGGNFSYEKPQVKSVEYPKLLTTLPTQEGKTHVITGTTSGTGLVFAKTVVHLGGTVICLNRPSERAVKAEEIIRNSGPGKVEMVDCDLKDFESVRSAAAKVRELAPDGIYSLVNNAGVMALPAEPCPKAEGLDVQMTVNCLSAFLLTKELFPLIKKGSEKWGESRIVQHSSGARKLPPGDLEERYWTKGGDVGTDSNGWMMNGDRWKRYHQTKLANGAFAYELADRIDAAGLKIKSTFAHPGLAATDLQATTTATGGMWQNPLTSLLMKMSQSPEDGTCGIIRCAMDSSDLVNNGSFFGPAGSRPYGPAISLPREDEKSCTDKPVNKELFWRCSEALLGKFEVK
mmetsp:Transcript_17863/g.35266  ORF Transcript_17863/g.35266 Transcript_17863/m.35266 type:complete len:345 (-) Transcript_17863:244-1278(-)|eukprot:CAMPEP_0171501312 /NCGR_PEP_ID=MMETSP0958-20121227/9485_1 /TAXON_ID=87120 /ORGANISM="Aurantiochytrium limacinum, Strain ATCCMYA-1381" /LENGTH=344 /DNA_ID=CAMNT_0012036107 /DNA_START=86 /DNA_END=1120 /DNA_ORIENTATION=+